MTKCCVLEETKDSIRQLISSTDGGRMIDISTIEYLIGASSSLWSGFIRGDLVCVIGVVPLSLISTQGYLWMHTTPKIAKHKLGFAKHSKKVLAEMLKQYDPIVGFVAPNNVRGIEWLKWLGATIYDIGGGDYKFLIRRG